MGHQGLKEGGHRATSTPSVSAQPPPAFAEEASSDPDSHSQFGWSVRWCPAPQKTLPKLTALPTGGSPSRVWANLQQRKQKAQMTDI